MLAAAAAVRQAVDEVTGLLSGRLTVGMVAACTITALFDALAAFHRAHPGVAITLLEDNSAALAERARSGAIDVALIGAAGGPPPDLACAARGVRLGAGLQATALNTVADLAARGLGVAILSETIAAAHAGRLRSVIIEDAELPALLALIWKPPPSPAAAGFLTHCRRAFPAASAS